MENKEIFMGNLSFEIAEGEIKSLCEEAGTVENIRVKKKKGIAFVTMSTEEEAMRVIELLDDKKLYGRNIRVTLKVDPRSAKILTKKRFDQEGKNLHKSRVKKEEERRLREEKKVRDKKTWEIKYGNKKKGKVSFKKGSGGGDDNRDSMSFKDNSDFRGEREDSSNRSKPFGEHARSGKPVRGKGAQGKKKEMTAADRRRAREWAGEKSYGSKDESRGDDSGRTGYGKRKGDDLRDSSGGRFKNRRDREESEFAGESFEKRRPDSGHWDKGKSGERDNRQSRRDREFSQERETSRPRSRRVSGSMNRPTGRTGRRKRD